MSLQLQINGKLQFWEVEGEASGGFCAVAAEERKVVVGERRGETPLGRLVAMQKIIGRGRLLI